MFDQLYDRLGTSDRELLTFWGTPGLVEMCNYVWDTRVPEVTDPWPTLDPLDPDDMIHTLLDDHPELIGELV